MQESEKNYYEILETPYESSFEEIEKNYQKARNAYSSDSLALYSLMSEKDCQKMLETIDEAYSILSDRQKRRLYDQARGITSSPTMRNPHYDIYQEDTLKENDRSHEVTSSSISKTIAAGIFSLNFEVNSEMEKKIEQAQVFDGPFLKEIREYKNVNLVRMSEMTKVSKTYLRYIEDESFTNLPAPVYVRGFVYQYAKSLKLNPELVANSYLTHMKKRRET